MNLTDIELVQRILTEFSNIQQPDILRNIGFLAVAVTSRFVVGKFKLGKRIATAEIAETTSRVRPFVNALVGPLSQTIIAIIATMDGRTLIPLLLGLAASVDFVFALGRAKVYQKQVFMPEKGFYHCGDFLEYGSAEECYIESSDLHYRKRGRMIVVKLTNELKVRLTGSKGIVDMTGIERVSETKKAKLTLDLQ